MHAHGVHAPSPPPGTWHLVQFYDSDEYVCGSVAEFFRAGVLRREVCLAVVTAQHRELISARLAELACDARAVTWLDADETLSKVMSSELPDREAFLRVVGGIIDDAIDGGRSLRAFGEMVDLLWRRNNPGAALQLERLWSELGETRAIQLLCAYDMKNFTAEDDHAAFRAICGAHGQVFPTEEYGALCEDEQRRRQVAILQQRARALETEILRRVDLEDAHRAIRERLALLAEASAMLSSTLDVQSSLTRVSDLIARRLGVVCDFELGDDAGPIRDALTAPLDVRGRIVGRLVVRSPQPLDVADVELVQELARRAASAVDNARLYEQARDANRRKEEFLAMLGHELRNPLAPIMTALQLAKLRGPPTREEQVIERQVKHLSRLVDDLLDVSRITRGKVTLSKERLEISTVIARAIEIASPLYERAAHSLSFEAPRSGLEVDADPVRLSQVIANLLTNAAKYTDPGGQIAVRAWRDGDEIAVSVTDNGHGIAPELLPRMFELFVQGDRPLDRAQGGLGIGLPLAKSLVELHGGHIQATSAGVGQGSEFLVRLPAASASMAATQPVPAIVVPVSHPPMRVLVVDDNQDAAELVAEALRGAGHEVAVAHDGPEALAIVPRFAPDAALVDIGLPVMDGYELATRLRGLDLAHRMRLVAVTGYGQQGDKLRSEEVGFDAHLVKPVGVDDLIASLVSH